jgi:hypothetical protein
VEMGDFVKQRTSNSISVRLTAYCCQRVVIAEPMVWVRSFVVEFAVSPYWLET